ncbi:MAG: Ig-like domain-containing protein [Muribaculaceae bacterium]|nr:Ig-like domain-containing protein [Muribaculaceae bacterium]
MNKFRLSFATLLILIAALYGLPARAITAIDKIYYEFDDGNRTARVVRTTYLANDNIGRIILPPTVKNLLTTYTVTEISANAFYGLYGLTEIILPETMKKIGEKAFINCSGLTSVTFPSSVIEIGSNAFSGCNLGSVTCEATIPPLAGGSVNPFSEETLRYATLNVPRESLDAYKQATGWNRFNIVRYIGQVDPTSIAIPAELEMNVESTYTLQASLSPSNTTETDIDWKSSNSGIVSVNSSGTLSANNTGTAKITATTTNGLTATCNVTVVRPVNSLSIAETGDLHVGDARKLNITIDPSNATDKTIEFNSSNPSVVSVSQDGVVSAKALGSVVITARAKSGVSASVNINVVPTPVTSISLPASTIINVGESSTLDAVIYPSNATYKTLTWHSSDTSVARVDAFGKVTGVAIGVADITAKAHNEVSATVRVSVVPIEVTSIELSASDLNLAVGKSASLSAKVLPQNATDKTVVWSTSDENVAIVNEAGRVTATGVGSAVITARTSNGISAICNVTVDIPVTSLIIDYAAMGLSDNTAQLKATEQIMIKVIINPEDATDKTLTFMSTDPTKASVSSDGVVTANSVGTALITVTATSGVKTVFNIKVIPTPAESITLNVEEEDLEVGEELNIVAMIAPVTTTDKTIIWTSSNPNVASVSNSGVVKALSLGETNITATASNGVQTSAKITVIPTLASSLTVSPSSLTLNVGDQTSLLAKVLPENTTDKSVTWMSSDESVVTVDAQGNVKALAEGFGIITAMTTDGTYLTASCDIIVNDPAGIEEISADQIDGELFTLSGFAITRKDNLHPGIYIYRRGGTVTKIRIK